MECWAALQKKSPKITVVFQFVGRFRTATVIWFHNDRITYTLNKLAGCTDGADHVVTGNRNTGSAITFFHLALEFDALDEIILCTGCNVEVGTQLCVHFQPILVVGFQPIDFSVMESEITDGADHLIVVPKIVHTVILRQTIF